MGIHSIIVHKILTVEKVETVCSCKHIKNTVQTNTQGILCIHILYLININTNLGVWSLSFILYAVLINILLIYNYCTNKI